MFYIGIDVGKHKHCAAITNSHGEVIIKPFYFDNNQAGFNLLLSQIKPYLSKRHCAGLEATGHYGDNLARFLLDSNAQVGIINPLTTDGYRKQKIRKTKNDTVDALLICSVLEARNYTTLTHSKLTLKEGKQLSRYRQELMASTNSLKNQLQACLDLVFPEFNSLFKTKYSKAYVAILKSYPSARIIANTHLTKLKSTLLNASKGRINHDYPKQLKNLALVSIGEESISLELKIKQLITTIELVSSQIEEIDKKIEELALQLHSPIFTIPGIGFITGFSILCEIQDVSLFASSKKLIAFAGVDPATKQSGDYNAPTTAISKRGSPHLRLSLYQAALPASRFNTTFNSYYTKKRKQGKSHRCALGHLVRKILRVIYKLLSENILFEPSLCV